MYRENPVNAERNSWLSSLKRSLSMCPAWFSSASYEPVEFRMAETVFSFRYVFFPETR